MGVFAGVAEMMGVESALLLLLVVVVVARTLEAGLTSGTFGEDAVLAEVALVLAAVVDDFLEVETRGFLGGVLVDLVVTAVDGDMGCASACSKE